MEIKSLEDFFLWLSKYMGHGDRLDARMSDRGFEYNLYGYSINDAERPLLARFSEYNGFEKF